MPTGCSGSRDQIACKTAGRNRPHIAAAAYHERNPAVGELLIAEVDLPVVVGVQPTMVDVANDAHDLTPCWLLPWH